MTRVNQMVEFYFQSSALYSNYEKKKNIPSITTLLTAAVYFKPKLTFLDMDAEVGLLSLMKSQEDAEKQVGCPHMLYIVCYCNHPAMVSVTRNINQ